MTYLKTLPTLTVKDQASAITELVTQLFLDNGWADFGSDDGQNIIFNKDGLDIYFKKGYFGANSEPHVYDGWYKGEGTPEAEEMVDQVDTYLSELKKAILNK